MERSINIHEKDKQNEWMNILTCGIVSFKNVSLSEILPNSLLTYQKPRCSILGKKNLILHLRQSLRSWAGIHQWALVGAGTWPGTASARSLSSFCSRPVINRALLPVQPHHAHFSASTSLTSSEKPMQVLAASCFCSHCISGQKPPSLPFHLANPAQAPHSCSWTPSHGSRFQHLK